ncbi:MAG TPA: hypothetical protein VE152_04135, partial [Acidimicrobiales bacterium]|nr:hypothetical protein [Acidimicrobiales bacterium]
MLPPEQGFYRIHWADRGAWWFSSDGSGRFDLERPRGTCYVAQDALGAFAEVGARLTYLDPEELARRSLACLRVPRPLYVADVISPLAADVGVGARCRTGMDYPR